jgi:hypothetical protein
MIRDDRIRMLEEVKKGTPYTQEDIVYKQEKRLRPVYRIPTRYLIYNKYNGRILSPVKSFERQFRILNPEHDEDKRVIEEFLWQSKPDRNQATLEDLKEWGQKRVGIVTRDGIVIDGNRRCSLLNKLGEEYFNAVILDDTMDNNVQEIVELETTYQMGEDEKLDYNPIEKYLKCKDLVELGFKVEKIGKMMRQPESQIEEWLNIMDLMDDYLDELGYTGIYTRLEKREGQFVDLTRYLKRYENGATVVDWPYTESDITDLKLICFDYIRAQYEGKEFRAIGQPNKKGESFFCKQKVWGKFREEHFNTIEAINDEESPVDELRAREPDGDLSKILRVRDQDWTLRSGKFLQSNLSRSQRDIEDIVAANEPKVLLRRAKDTLGSINPNVDAFRKDREVARLVEEVGKVLSQLQKQTITPDN